MEQQTPKIEAGRVFLPKDAPWLHEFKVEVMAFPNGKHDDQIDSLSQFLVGLATGNGGAANSIRARKLWTGHWVRSAGPRSW